MRTTKPLFSPVPIVTKHFPLCPDKNLQIKISLPRSWGGGKLTSLQTLARKKKLFYSRICRDAGSCVAVPPILMKRVPKNQIRSDAICGKASFVLGTEEGLLTRSWPQNVRRHSDTIRSGDRTKHHYWKLGRRVGHRWKGENLPEKKEERFPAHFSSVQPQGFWYQQQRQRWEGMIREKETIRGTQPTKVFQFFPYPSKWLWGGIWPKNGRKWATQSPFLRFWVFRRKRGVLIQAPN